MKTKGFVILFSLTALMLVVSLACGFSIGDTPTAPTPIQSNPPTQPNQPIQKPTDAPPTQQPSNPTDAPPTQQPSNPPDGLQTFTDENDLYQIQLPGDWVYKQVTGDNYYLDQFKSPDEQALFENIVYDDGTTFNGGQKGRFALDLIYRFYSSDGTSSDIKITSDQLMDDGSERLIWNSKGGGYSGASYFETREGRTTFLMLTIEWMNSAEALYLDTLNEIVASYAIP